MPSRAILKTPARSQMAPPSEASRIGVTKRGMEARKDASKNTSRAIVGPPLPALRRQDRAGHPAGDEEDDHSLHDQRDFVRHAGRALHSCRAGLDCREEEAGEWNEPG